MKFNIKNYVLLVVVVFFSVSCSTKQNIYSQSGAVEITETFYYIKTEVSNKDWKTYLEWIEKHHGINSDEFFSALPDTLVWRSLAYNEPTALTIN